MELLPLTGWTQPRERRELEKRIDWLVAGALAVEVAPLIAALTARRHRPEWSGVEGEIGGRRVLAIATGVGADRAERAIAEVMDRIHPPRVIVCGLCGGLDAAFETGDVVLASEVEDDTGSQWRADPEFSANWLDRPLAGIRLRTGRLFSTRTVLRTPEAKHALREGSGAAVVDMESAGAARALANRAEVVFFVRAVIDDARATVPDGLEALVDVGTGRARFSRAILWAVCQPFRIGELLDFGRRSRRACRRLGEAVTALIVSDGA
jgi:nucleoside phosphorylase